MKRNIIIKEYFRTWFVPDFLTSIPIYMLFTGRISEAVHYPVDILLIHEQGINSSIRNATASFFIILELVKLLRVLKFTLLFDRIFELIMTETMEMLFKAFKITVTIFLVAHWLACIFFLIGKTQGKNHDMTWLRFN